MKTIRAEIEFGVKDHLRMKVMPDMEKVRLFLRLNSTICLSFIMWVMMNRVYPTMMIIPITASHVDVVKGAMNSEKFQALDFPPFL